MQLHHAMPVAIIAATLFLTGCHKSTSAKSSPPKGPAIVEEAGGIKRISLQEIETKRLGIELAEVTQTQEGLVMPYSALLYEPTGKEWAYASPKANTFIRTPLKVKTIESDKVVLLEGPPPGTQVVTKGSVELYGIDFGIGK